MVKLCSAGSVDGRLLAGGTAIGEGEMGGGLATGGGGEPWGTSESCGVKWWVWSYVAKNPVFKFTPILLQTCPCPGSHSNLVFLLFRSHRSSLHPSSSL